ncbi:hypothetical protein H1R20_g807, partial [Candolleomyces eurysporus]
MNIRSQYDSQQGAYPPPDLDMVGFIRSIPLTASKDEVVPIFILFFRVLFTWVAKELDTLSYQKEQTDRIASKWRAHLQNRRQAMYGEVCGEVRSMLNNGWKAPYKANADEAMAALNVLIDKVLAAKEGCNELSIFMYVDEAHTLNEDIGGSSVYSLMIKALSVFNGQSFFVLFVSTVFCDHKIVAPGRLARSHRYFAAGDKLLAPYTEMPFDCHPNFPLSPGVKLEDIIGLSFLCMFGRPIFWTLFEEDPTVDLKTLAIRKLICSAQFELSSLATAAKFAVLDVLLNLDYRLLPFSHDTIQTMVASHMRTVYSAPQSREYLRSGYSSEPVLAEAAMEILHLNESGALKDQFVDAAAKLFVSLDAGPSRGAIDMGRRGDNVGKMILLRAYMSAVKESSSKLSGIDWSDGCSLVAFLKHLTADGFHQTVLECKPDNIANPQSQTLATVFANSWIRFTHFARAADNTAVTTSAAWPAFLRSMAFICSHSQETIDVSIPVLLDKTATIEEKNMTIIAVQFKRRTTGRAATTYAIDARKIGVFPSPKSPRNWTENKVTSGSAFEEKVQYNSRPYISLVMELGVQTLVHRRRPNVPVEQTDVGLIEQRTSVHSTQPFRAEVVALGPEKRNSSRASNDQDHPRYSLVFYGCSSRVYGCISQESDDDYGKLLQLSGNGFADHPRANTLSQVLNMKPFWEASPESYGWVNDEWLQNAGYDGYQNADNATQDE